jgi:hypothetical protein
MQRQFLAMHNAAATSIEHTAPLAMEKAAAEEARPARSQMAHSSPWCLTNIFEPW